MTINGKKNIRELLAIGTKILSEDHEQLTPRLDCEILLAHTLKCKRIDLILHNTKQIDTEQQTIFFSYINRRMQHEPISYITNEKEFMSLSFFVDEGILVPRPETEMLVEYLIKQYQNTESLSVLDLCTGSGAIAVSVAYYIKHAQVTAVDKYEACVRVAEKNAMRHQCLERIRFIQADVLKPLSIDNLFHCIVSNPPYIQKDVIPTLSDDVKNFEPLYALDGGDDGLIFYRAIVSFAKDHLFPLGKLMFEIGYDQGETVKKIILDSGVFHSVEIIKDFAGQDRMVIATREEFPV